MQKQANNGHRLTWIWVVNMHGLNADMEQYCTQDTMYSKLDA